MHFPCWAIDISGSKSELDLPKIFMLLITRSGCSLIMLRSSVRLCEKNSILMNLAFVRGSLLETYVLCPCSLGEGIPLNSATADKFAHFVSSSRIAEVFIFNYTDFITFLNSIDTDEISYIRGSSAIHQH